MGLFDRLRGSAPVAKEVLRLVAPVSGKTVALGDIPDPAFSSGVLGKGCGIIPINETVVSPVAGSVTVVMGHAIGITTARNIEVLVHVGIDTVRLEGRGFTNLVGSGEHVESGQPLIAFDRASIHEAGYNDIVITVITSTEAVGSADLVVAPGGMVSAGGDLLSVTLG